MRWMAKSPAATSQSKNMEWLNLHTSVLDSPTLVGEEPVNRATWLFLLRFCVGQENGGVIAGAATWGDRKWQQLCRVTLAEVKMTTPLWHWDGQDLHLALYPHQAETKVKTMREFGRKSSPAKASAAKANGAKGGRPGNNPTENPTETQQETQPKPNEKPNENPTKNPYKERKGKGIVREGKNNKMCVCEDGEDGAGREGAAGAHTHTSFDQDWVGAVASDHPRIDAEACWPIYLANCQRKGIQPMAATWSGWLSRETTLVKRQSAPVKTVPQEPPGWRRILEAAYPDNLINRDQKPWDCVPAEIIAKLWPELV